MFVKITLSGLAKVQQLLPCLHNLPLCILCDKISSTNHIYIQILYTPTPDDRYYTSSTHSPTCLDTYSFTTLYIFPVHIKPIPNLSKASKFFFIEESHYPILVLLLLFSLYSCRITFTSSFTIFTTVLP